MLKTIVTILAVCLSLVGSIWAMEDRYVSDKDAASSLQLFDRKVQYELKNLKEDILSRELDYATSRYFRLKALASRNPRDLELKEELEEAYQYRDQLRKGLK